MLTSALTEALQRFLGTRKLYAPLTSYVTDLSQRYERVLSRLPKVPQDSSKWQSVFSEMHQVMAEAGTALRGKPSSGIFKAAEHLEEALSLVPLPAPVEKVTESLAVFKRSLDTFIEGQSASAGFDLLLAAHNLGTRYDALVEVAESVSLALEPESVANSGRLVISVDDDLSLDEMAEFLRAFATVYRQLGEIAQLEGSDRELQARRIESGSWWMDLAGHPAVMPLLASLVTAVFAWGHRRYTNEGRSKSLPEKIDAVQKALGLREKLKDAGFKVDNLEGSIQTLEGDVARELTTLFEPRRRLRVDNTVYTRIEPTMPEQAWPALSMDVAKLPSQVPPTLFLTDDGNGT